MAWFGVQYLCAVYENIQIRDLMSRAIVEHHQANDDETIVDMVVTGVKEKGPFTIKRKDVDVLWDNDRKGITVTASYYKTVTIPLLNKKWILRFNPTAKERFDF